MFLYNIKIKIRDYAVKISEGKYAKRWLAFFAFAEASFFPIPPDVFLIAILASNHGCRWKRYALITSIWSVIGGLAGYAIGMFLYDSIGIFLINLYGLEQYIAIVKAYFVNNAFLAMFIAGFSPIPYKIFTLSAGFFGINIMIFLLASIISRSMRFFAVAYIMKVFGREIGSFVFKYFNLLTLVLSVIIVVLIILFSFV